MDEQIETTAQPAASGGRAERYRKAKQRLAEIKGFYIHLAVFILVMTILGIVNIANPEVWWVQWPLLGWGAGLLFHWALVFSSAIEWSRNWEERKLRELMKDD